VVPELADWVAEDVDDEELEAEDAFGKKQARKKAKQRRRILEYDEDLDQIVARRKRKPSRQRNAFYDYEDLDE